MNYNALLFVMLSCITFHNLPALRSYVTILNLSRMHGQVQLKPLLCNGKVKTLTLRLPKQKKHYFLPMEQVKLSDQTPRFNAHLQEHTGSIVDFSTLRKIKIMINGVSSPWYKLQANETYCAIFNEGFTNHGPDLMILKKTKQE